MDIKISRIVDSITATTFKEKADEIINLLSLPYDHISGIYSYIAQANYMISSGRNKYSDEYIRESFREQIKIDLEELKQYGPLKRFKVAK